MRRKSLLAILLGICASPAFAQLSSSVSVEGEYEPIVIETERLNTFPQGYRFELPAANVEYDYTGIVTQYRPDILTMGVTGRDTGRPWNLRKGFVDFRLGSYLNSRLHAGYNILSDSVNTLSADLKFVSSSLYRSDGIPSSFTRMARKRLYDGRIGLNYSRVISTEGLLSASVAYRLGYFNYYGTTMAASLLPAGRTSVPAPSQTFHQANASVSYKSAPSLIRGWHAGASVDFLGFRRLYGSENAYLSSGLFKYPSQKGDRETNLNIDAGYSFNFADVNAIAIDADASLLFYGKGSPEVLGITDYSRKNYGTVTLTPAYRYENDGFLINAGADLALSWNAMGSEPGKHFGAFHVAPDVTVQYGSKTGVGMFVSATGGVAPSTLALKETFDLYQLPWQISTTPVYTPLDARLGLNFGPFSGFTGSVAFRYAIARNIPLGGWYQVFLGTLLPDGFTPVPVYSDAYIQSLNLHGLSLQMKLRYAFGTTAEVQFDGSFTPQNGKTGIFNGFDRPKWVLGAKAAVHPLKRLSIEAGYDFRGARNCFYREATGGDDAIAAYKLRNISDLHLRAGYRILDNFEIYCMGVNLLNRRVDLLPGLQSEGIAISGGIVWDIIK